MPQALRFAAVHDTQAPAPRLHAGNSLTCMQLVSSVQPAHACVVASQRGAVASGQSVFSTHATHVARGSSQSAVVLGVTRAHWASAVQPTHACAAVSQCGAAAVVQSVSARQLTHVREANSQCEVAASVQSMSARQPTHMFAATAHT